ncbi:hypothetical protein EHQ43_06110 [Leptospira bouyouniensis]|uniref:Uncharacterized protein n=1 Tax=Leptospira bouyouniensis TaxID=2484911 RepID=A0A7I0HTX6_9LEPT|nr:hypothetical protein EHQ43_06110 [Leptospira bouyouniensis]
MQTSYNSDLPLRFGTRPRSGYAKLSSCHSLAYASYVPVPNVPFRDSGSDNFGKSSSLCVI